MSATDSAPRHHGCFNRPPFAPGYWGQAGWRITQDGSRLPVMEFITNVMSKDCQHDSGPDPECHECRWQRENTETEHAP
jgi:hypothetical protein